MAKQDFSRHWLADQMGEAFQRLGARLRLARKGRGESIEDVAIKLSVSPSTLRRLEKGSAGASLGLLYLVLHHLGMQGDIDKLASLDELELLSRGTGASKRMDRKLFDMTEDLQ